MAIKPECCIVTPFILSREGSIARDGQNPQLRRKFVQSLTAGAAGIGHTAVRCNGDGGELPRALADGLEQRRAFGAVGQPEGGILDVAAGKDPAVGAEQRRAHRIMAVGRVAVFQRPARQFQQFAVCDGSFRIPADPGHVQGLFFHFPHLLLLVFLHVVIAHQVEQSVGQQIA